MSDRRARRTVVLASMVLMLVVGVGAVLWQRTPSRSTAPAPVERVTSTARHRYSAAGELVAASDLVVVGRVVADERGRLFGPAGGSATVRSHVLTLEVERVLAGAPATPGALVLVEEEHSLADGTRLVVDGMRAGRVGDRGIWFLSAGRDPDLPAFAVVNSQGRYLFAGGGALHGGDPSDALVRRLESEGAAGLEARLSG